MQDSEKGASFYRDHFGFEVKRNSWSAAYDFGTPTPGERIRVTDAKIPGTEVPWGFMEFKGVDRKPYTPRILDPSGILVELAQP